MVLAVAAGVVASQALERRPADTAPAGAASPAPALFPVTIRQPAGAPTIDTGHLDEMGRPIVANCTTCHTTKAPNPRISGGHELQDFHQGLVTNHGGRTCLSCHNPQDYNQLRLADGKPVEFKDVMTLCAQCHGTQYRDYQHGAHGGMTGHWDLTRGPRARNNCIDCHDPHAPQYPQVMPVLRPNDRFLRTPGAHDSDTHDSEDAHD
jgi:hypothetical protein